MQDRSLGLIETLGYTAAVEAVDAACKAARVMFIGHERVDRGLITVKFAGDVAAVQAAVAAGAAAAQRVGQSYRRSCDSASSRATWRDRPRFPGYSRERA